MTYITSDYPFTQPSCGIVHIGLGAFHRAHQAVYIERNLQRHGGGSWGILAANIRSNHELVDAMRAADQCYHVVEYRGKDKATVREVRAIRQCLFAGKDRDELLAALVADTTRIVTLTVTEKGYGIEPASGQLRADDEAIKADLLSSDGSRSVPGMLVTALAQRRALGRKPFTVLSCDNMPHNGQRLRTAVLAMARARDSMLEDWIAEQVSFPSSMVDRIVPAVTEQALALIKQQFQVEDPLAVVTEAFSQWVIEDNFCNGRPDLEGEGVQFVADVSPYETMKLRLLNGAHSLLAYCGQILEMTTVDEAIGHPVLLAMVQRYFEETCPSVTVDYDLTEYTHSLIQRFRNDTLKHQLVQIATDGSQKIPQRWLSHLATCCVQGGELPATEQALAGWMYYMSGQRFDGSQFLINDPLVAQLAACSCEGDALQIVRAYLNQHTVFPASLKDDSALIERLSGYLRGFMQCENVDDAVQQVSQWNT